MFVIGNQEIWLNDRVVQVLPALRDDLHPRIKDAVARRRLASLTGRCDCGGEMEIDGPLTPGSTVRGRMWHEPDCSATDIAIAQLFERFGGAS
jgi:hypothetical protein